MVCSCLAVCGWLWQHAGLVAESASWRVSAAVVAVTEDVVAAPAVAVAKTVVVALAVVVVLAVEVAYAAVAAVGLAIVVEVVADTVVVVVVAVVVDVAVVVVAVEHGVVAEASFGCVIAMVELLVEVLKFLVVQNLGPRDDHLYCLTTSHLVWLDAVMQNRCRMKKKNGVDGDGAFATNDLATRFAL